MESNDCLSILSYLSENSTVFVQDLRLSSSEPKSESVSEVNLKIRIPNKNLLSPVYPYNSDVKLVLNQLIVHHYNNVVEKEISLIKDDRIDRGLDDLTEEEVHIETIKRQQAYLSAFEKNPEILDIGEVYRNLNSCESNPLSMEGLKIYISQNNFLERGYLTIVQHVLNCFNQHQINFAYIKNDIPNRTLSINEYTPSESVADADESFQLIVSVESDANSNEHGISFNLKMRFLKKYQWTPKKLVPCINEIVQSISQPYSDPKFASYSRRRSTIRADIGSSLDSENFNFLESLSTLEPETSPVTCSVYAPAKVKRAESVMVQVFAHLPENIEEAEQMALSFDESSSKRAQKRLTKEVAIGSTLHFSLSIAGLDLDNSEEDLIWNNETESVQFMVEIPSNFSKNSLIGKIIVSQDSIPIGHMLFKMDVDESNLKNDAPVRSEMKQYQHAFISYASDDRDEVLRRVQMLQSVKISFFQDILDLNPGDIWEDELYNQIDKADVFFLFWSAAAKESEWVAKEINHALKRIAHEDAPEIIPIILNAPPVVTPPESLKHIHFNDRLAYFIKKEPVEKSKGSRIMEI